MKDIYSNTFDSRSDQPSDPGVYSKREIREAEQEYIESKDFDYYFGNAVVDEITDQQWGILGRYMESGDDLAAGRYFAELTRHIRQRIIDSGAEDILAKGDTCEH